MDSKNLTKSQLAIILSKLNKPQTFNEKLEQYLTDCEIASQILWKAYFDKNIENKTIADLGAGTGIFGIGCLILNAKKVYFVEKDPSMIESLNKNIQLLKEKGFITERNKFEIFEIDIINFNTKVNTVIQNPPFGTRIKHTDKVFLEKAFSISNVVYSLHKTSTSEFIIKLTNENNFNLKEKIDLNFPLKQTYKHHKKHIQRIEVSCFYLERNKSL